MGKTSVQQRPETNPERASRVRDNKRRHRARQKEHVLELQRRVAETRERGIQVTKEVQLAAQGVARENAKLRDLLRWVGYTDDKIDAWVRGDTSERPQPVTRFTVEQVEQKIPLACGLQKDRKLEARDVGIIDQEPNLMKVSKCGECPDKESSQGTLRAPSATTSEISSSRSQQPDSGGAPCKLVTLLAKNPAADITQVPLITESSEKSHEISNPDECSSDGIECSAAYKMLMQYATSGESMDRIATALESGCVPSAAGGCKVKKSVVWDALDKECT